MRQSSMICATRDSKVIDLQRRGVRVLDFRAAFVFLPKTVLSLRFRSYFHLQAPGDYQTWSALCTVR